MSNRSGDRDSYGFDLPFGLILGLLGGAVAGILFAPKPGKELQDDVQRFVNNLPTDMNKTLHTSKDKAQELVGKTRQTIETQMEKREHRRQAVRMAEAKRREELETGTFEY